MLPALLVLIPLLQAPSPQPAPTAYVQERVFDTRRRAFGDFEVMLADLARADVVFVGEQHDDPNTHALELAVLEGLNRRGVRMVLALEMFERDVQGVLDGYAAGDVSEDDFLKQSRPWPRYRTDYRPLIEFARSHRIPIVASNVPRRIAAMVSKDGPGAIEALGHDRELAARDLECPTTGDYYDRFVAAMAEHPMPGDGKAVPEEARGRNDRFYLAQCVKDETMAESIAVAVGKAANAPPTLVHVNGAFHSDFAEGTAERTRRRLPGSRVAVVSVLPVDDIDAAWPSREDLKRADYLVYTVSRPTTVPAR